MRLRGIGLGFGLLLMGGAAFAQLDRPLPPPPVSFDLGIDLRLRQETLHNLLDFDDDVVLAGGARRASDADYYRIRPRVTGVVKLRSGLGLTARFTSEVRKYIEPYEAPAKTQVILDNFFIDAPRSLGLPVSLRIGRQDIIRGEGFILLEGGPLDGSRSIYQNAVLATLEGEKLGLGKTNVDLLAIRNLAWDPMVIANGPTDAEKNLGLGKIVENDETAFGVYATSVALPPQTLETYFIYKEEEPPAAQDPILKISTAGLRLSGQLPYNVSYAFEAAGQFGSHAVTDSAGTREFDHSSYGGYISAKRQFPAFFFPTLKVGGIYLSGDDLEDMGESDEIHHGWYPVFARWPKWSELYLYSLMAPSTGTPNAVIRESRVGEWSNLAALSAGLALKFGSPVTFTYDYYYLRAPESIELREPAFFGDGHLRGHLHEWKLEAVFSGSISGHFLVERFAPGDFYANPKDDAFFIRWQIMLAPPWL